jgi:hypothetical protein
MWRLSFAAIAFLTIGLAAEGRDTRTSQAFELKRIIEAIQPGTGKGAVEEALKSLALPYRQIFRREFHSDSATWMVEPLPDAAVSALTGSGGGRPGKDDDFVFFVVMFDIDERVVASKAKVLGYW